MIPIQKICPSLFSVEPNAIETTREDSLSPSEGERVRVRGLQSWFHHHKLGRRVRPPHPGPLPLGGGEGVTSVAFVPIPPKTAKNQRISWSAALSCVLVVATTSAGPAGEFRRGMVASVHPLATEAGLNALKSGGNAIDAAVAVGLTLGVVDADNSGIGGGCFMLIRLANGKFVAIDGREMAPAAATRGMFVRNGNADTELSQTGALASGVPGEVAAFEYAVKKFGRKKLSELILPAAEIAEKGFTLNHSYASRLKSVADDMAKFESSRAVFFKDGAPLRQGDVFKQPDLAATYRGIAGKGSDWFYRGPFAQATEKWMKISGGLTTAADFANYQIKLREPVATTYRGYKIVSFAPPSSGGVHVVQMLNILEKFDLKSLDEATRLHVIAEAMKLAFADRAFWLGDPDFAKVPRGLVSKKYAASLAKKIDPERATEVPSRGSPAGWERDVFTSLGRSSRRKSALTPQDGRMSGLMSAATGFEDAPARAEKHTTHWSIADAEGNWVAVTATVNTSFGSKVVIPGTGVVLNNQMDDFAIQPGVPNAFGLIGADANAVAPGKRPLSSMSPTIVLKGGKPIIALGAAGGPKIISAVLLELIDMLDLGMSPQEAIGAPRIHHQWSPGELMVEKALPESLKTALEQRGHVVRELNSFSVSHIVARSADGKSFVGAADPRAGGNAAGW
jgi:gamma-glutamyltranspeptidase/glutathione hydrolase